MRQLSGSGGELLFPNRGFAAPRIDEMASIGVDAVPSSGNTSGLVGRSTSYAALHGSPLYDNLTGIKASAYMKGIAEAVVY
jgi:hypothetical protein